MWWARVVEDLAKRSVSAAQHELRLARSTCWLPSSALGIPGGRRQSGDGTAARPPASPAGKWSCNLQGPHEMVWQIPVRRAAVGAEET